MKQPAKEFYFILLTFTFPLTAYCQMNRVFPPNLPAHNTLAIPVSAGGAKASYHVAEFRLEYWQNVGSSLQNASLTPSAFAPAFHALTFYFKPEIIIPETTYIPNHQVPTDRHNDQEYRVHPSAIITNGPMMPVAERKLLYWASRTSMRFLGRRTGTYAIGSPSEISATSLPHTTEPRRAGSSPR